MSRDYDAEKAKIIQAMIAKGASKYEAEKLSNEQINAAKQGPSAFEQAKEDESAIAAQHDAMNSYKERIGNGGFTAADTAAQNQATRQASQADNARRQSIMQEMQQRGQAGGGSELAQRLASADSAGAQNADASQQIAARGEANRTAAIGASAGLASTMRNQTAQSQDQLAAGRDSVNKFNADLTARSNAANMSADNQASQYNANSQGQFDQNTGQMQYNSVAEAQNIEAQKAAAAAAKKKGQMGAILGVAGGVAGGVIGSAAGPMGTVAGASVGASAGGALGNAFAHGGKVPGHAHVAGDSPANDTVTAHVSPGEVVVPRSIAGDPSKAAEFVAHANDKEEQDEGPSMEETILAIAKALSSLKGK